MTRNLLFRRREVKKHRTHTKTQVLLLKVFLFVIPIGILLYDVILSLQPGPKLTLTGYAKVTDGDTLVVGERVVRLAGIDAPEGDQSCRGSSGRLYLCGEEASRALTRLVRFSRVTCEQQGARDRYGRVVARCSTRGWLTWRSADLSAALVAGGHAVVYRQYAGKHLAELAQLERDARLGKRGIWQGTFELPENWRRRKQMSLK